MSVTLSPLGQRKNNMVLVCGKLRDHSKIDNAKKDPYRVLMVNDRLFYVVPETMDSTLNMTKNVPHSDIEFIFTIQVTKDSSLMVKTTVDDYLKMTGK